MVDDWCAAVAVIGILATATPACAAGASEVPAPWPLTLTYFGETATHPGLLVGSEQPLWQNGWNSLVATGDLGGYVHPANHTGWMVRGGLSHRLTFPTGWSTDAQMGLGYLHTFLAGDAYREVDGKLEKQPDGGRPSLMPVVSLGLGFDAARLGMPASRLFGRLVLFGQAPANQGVLWRPALEAGVSWAFQ